MKSKMKNYVNLAKKFFITKKIYLFIFFSIVLNAIKLTFPLITKYTIDYIVMKQFYKFSKYVIIVFITISCFYFFLSLLLNKNFMLYVNEKSKEMRLTFLNNAYDSIPEMYNNKNTGDIVYRLVNDVSVITNSWSSVFGALPSQLLMIFPILYFLRESMELLILTIFAVFINAIVLFIYLKISEKYISKVKTESQNFSKQIFDKISKIEIIKIFNAGDYCSQSIEGVISKQNKANLDYFICIKKYENFVFILNSGWSLLMLFIGASFVKNSTITLGTLIAYIYFSNMIFQPIGNLVAILQKSRELSKSAERVIQYFPFNNEFEQNEHQLTKVKSINVQNLEIFLPDNQKILKKVSFEIDNPGIYAISGKNGTGKTTFAKILIKLCSRYSGKILINDEKLENIKTKNLRDHIIYIGNDDAIFAETLIWNLTFNDLNKDYNKYSWLLNKTLRDKLYLGKTTNMSDDIIKLSNGEKQLIYLIRALILNPDVMIFDEPENSFDGCMKKKIKTVFEEYANTKIVILITHSEYFKNLAKEVFDFDKFQLS